MNRRYLIDDVCLWCARVFAGLSVFVFTQLAYFFLHIPRPWEFSKLEGMQMVVLMLAVSVLWIVCLWNQRSPGARLFLGLSGVLFFAMTCRQVAIGIFGSDWLDITFTFAALIGLPAMLWVAVGPLLAPRRLARV